MALVRLRPVAGDAALSERVTEARDNFVYSGTPLDVENIRHLRGRQADELVQRGALNAKYSRGGLTDVEYFVQAWQVAEGREDESLRVTNTLDAIAFLAEADVRHERAGGRDGGDLRLSPAPHRRVASSARPRQGPDGACRGHARVRVPGAPAPVRIGGGAARRHRRDTWPRPRGCGREPTPEKQARSGRWAASSR